MNWLDLLIIAILIWSGWTGFQRGLITEICHTGAALLALYVAYRFADGWSVGLTLRLGIAPGIARILSFIVLLLGTVSIGFAAEPLIQRLLSVRSRNFSFDRLGGALIGLIKGTAFVIIAIVAASELPWYLAHHAVSESIIAIHLLRMAPAIYVHVQQFVSSGENPL